ncbi:hypothetical protein Pcinc_037251 [Petrolisthes cinctipes]|uniref:Uncharacterized protein n=1 Tax=Petrolisthes cinctipes TaxID=88211 RepID=A0AAE1BSX3_PETCI|nr:hypothetical protein Pcinc_037251 [Petrolisthes cinctipes]
MTAHCLLGWAPSHHRCRVASFQLLGTRTSESQALSFLGCYRVVVTMPRPKKGVRNLGQNLMRAREVLAMSKSEENTSDEASAGVASPITSPASQPTPTTTTPRPITIDQKKKRLSDEVKITKQQSSVEYIFLKKSDIEKFCDNVVCKKCFEKCTSKHLKSSIQVLC